TQRCYAGINPVLLRLASVRHGWRSKFWGTLRQWNKLGGKVMRRPDHVPAGQWGTQIVLFMPVVKTEVNRATGEEAEVKYRFLRTYTVFSADQVEGPQLDQYRAGATPESDFVDYGPAERAIQATGADIRHGGDRAFYRMPSLGGDGDFIQIPHKDQFSS